MRIFFLLFAFFSCQIQNLWSTDFLFVASQGNTVIVINTSTNQIVAAIPTGGGTTPEFVAVAQPLNAQPYVYVSDAGSGQVTVINPTTFQIVATITVGSTPQSLTSSPDGTRVYVTNESSHSVSVIDTSANVVIATIGVAGFPNGIASNGSLVYVSAFGPNTMTVINAATNTVSTSFSFDNGFLSFSPDGSTLYVAGQDTNTLRELAVPSNVAGNTFAVPNVEGVAATPDGTLVYTANDNSNNVSVLNTSSQTITATIPVTGDPIWVTSTSDSAFAYVSKNSAGDVIAISTSTNTVVATISVTAPFGSAIYNNSPRSMASAPQGVQESNRFLTQTDFFNIVSWQAPLNFTPVEYLIFRDAALTQLAATIPASTLVFEDHNRTRKVFYTYFVVAVNSSGTKLSLGSVTVEPLGI